MAKRYITCKRCGQAGLAWARNDDTGRYYLVTATKVGGVVFPDVSQPHVCPLPPHLREPERVPLPVESLGATPESPTYRLTVEPEPDPVEDYVARGRALVTGGPYAIGFRHEETKHHVPDVWIDVDTLAEARAAIAAFENRPGNAVYSLMGVWNRKNQQVPSLGGMKW